jgi:hypothetical protein
MSKYYLKLNLPSLGTDVLDKITDCLIRNKKYIEAPFPIDITDYSAGPIEYKIHSPSTATRTTLVNSLIEESNLSTLKNWPGKVDFVKNITEPYMILDFNKLKFSIQRIEGLQIPCHSDIRTCSLIYTVKGPATTNWYSSNEFKEGSMYLDKSKLILEESVNMDLNSWYLFNHYEIHDVENIEGRERISFVINLSDRFKNFEDAKNNIQEIFL